MFKKSFFCILFLFILITIPVLNVSAASTSTTYTPMEKIPGFENAMGTDFYTYLKALYGFMVWGVGVSAMLMIVIGGFMYITAAGNSSSITKAKGVITDALFGLVLALVSYLCLYIINPDLVNIKKISNATSGSIGTNTSVPDAASAAKTPLTCTSNDCSVANNAITSNSSGVDPNILKAVIVGGEGCNSNTSSDGHGSCGYGQVLPKNRTWCGISGTPEETCAKVKADVNLDINCAAKLMKDGNGNCNATDINVVASCYNAGQPGKCAQTTNNYCDRVSNYYNNCANK